MAATEPRSTTDIVSLLLELTRVVKARRYFEPGDQRLAPLFEHARRAWLADLRRHGALELGLGEGRLDLDGQSFGIDTRLEAALSEWTARGVRHLRVESDLDADALAGLVEVLAMSEQAVDREGGLTSALLLRVPFGIQLETAEEGGDRGAASAGAAPEPLEVDAPLDEGADTASFSDEAGDRAGGDAAAAEADTAVLRATETSGPHVDEHPTTPLVLNPLGLSRDQAAALQLETTEPDLPFPSTTDDDVTQPSGHPAADALADGEDPTTAGDLDTDEDSSTATLAEAADDSTAGTIDTEGDASAARTIDTEDDASAASTIDTGDDASTASTIDTGDDASAARTIDTGDDASAASTIDTGDDASAARTIDTGDDASAARTIDTGDDASAARTIDTGDEASAARTIDTEDEASAARTIDTEDEASAARTIDTEDEASAANAGDTDEDASAATTGDTEVDATTASAPASPDGSPAGSIDETTARTAPDSWVTRHEGRASPPPRTRPAPASPELYPSSDGPTEPLRGSAFDESSGVEERGARRTRGDSDTEPLPPDAIRAERGTDEETLPVGDSSDPHARSLGVGSPSDVAAGLLREMEASAADATGPELVDSLVTLVEAERETLGHAATLQILSTLAAQAEAKHEDDARAPTRRAIKRLATGETLEALLSEAGQRGSSAERAARVLTQLSPEIAGPLAVRAIQEVDEERAAQLVERLLALGPAAVEGPILELMKTDDRAVLLRALEIGREIGGNELVGRISELLRSEDEFVREAAAGALAHQASPEAGEDAQALRSLARGLTSADPHLAVLCAECLTTTRSARAVEPLAASLRAAVDAGDLDTARDRIRALGELGRPEAAAELGLLLSKKSLFGRRRLRELKLAATHALSRLPGDQPVGVLSQAAQSRDAQLRTAAQIALERRSPGLQPDRP